MAALGNGALTFADLVTQLGPDNQFAPFINLMAQRNGLTKNIPWRQGLLLDGDMVHMLTGLPYNGTAQWSTINKGIPAGKATFTSVQYKAGQLTGKTEVDKRELQIVGEGGFALLRARQTTSMIDQITQSMASAFLYETLANGAERINGLNTYYSTFSNVATIPSAANVITAGGATANGQSSMYLLTKDRGFYGFYPMNSTMGMMLDDRGPVETSDSAGSYTVFREYFYMNCGLAIPDWRQNVRICNIDTAGLKGGSPADLIGFSEQAVSLPTLDGDRFWICPRNVYGHIRRQARKAVGTGGGLTFDNFAGQEIVRLHGYPIYVEDQMLSTEAVVS